MIWTLAFLAIIVIHVRHVLESEGQRRYWHSGHVLMAFGMTFMFAPASLDHFNIPTGFWSLAFANGAIAVVLWMLVQTFAGRGAPKLENIIFAVEGQRQAAMVARKIARSLGGVPVTINSKNKPAYHAAGALVAGHGLGLVEAATQVLMKIGFSRRDAMRALLPLMRQMLDNFERLGPRESWTGPVSRGDFATVAKHTKALRSYPSEFNEAHAALALLASRVLSKNSAVASKQLKRALRKSTGGKS